MNEAALIEPVLPAWEAETKRVPLPLAQAGSDRLRCNTNGEI
jgi:hypothetical protein